VRRRSKGEEEREWEREEEVFTCNSTIYESQIISGIRTLVFVN